MRAGHLAILPVIVAMLAVAVWMGALSGLIWLTLGTDAERSTLLPALARQWPMLVLGWLGGVVALVWAWMRWVARPDRALDQLAEQARALLTGGAVPPASANQRARHLSEPIVALAAQRDALRADMALQVREASGRVQQEKDRLAALLSELPQSVLVCNLDGRVLLYNQRAHKLLGAVAGIGRSIHALIDPALLGHALQGVRHRLGLGEASCATQFVTYTQDARLLRVQMTPVLAGVPAESGPVAAVRDVTGLVLLLDDVTPGFARESERDRVLSGLTDGSRASLAAIRAAVEMLGYDDVEPEMRERFLAVVREETTRMGARIDELARRAADEVRTRWPLENMLGEDFIAAARRHVHQRTDRPISVDAVRPGLWLRVDSYSLLQALAYLARRLVDELEVRALQLRLQSAAGGRAQLDLIWIGHAVSTETVMGWELDPIQTGVERSQLTVREVVARHDGEMWLQRERAGHQAFFRFLLPLGEAREEGAAAVAPVASASRPDFYDFDLFQHRESDGALDDQPLTALRYTVFDTETTGLNPVGGDAIIQLGAVRIVNARLLPQERFEQLVNPERDVPEAGIAIHGITQAMVAGQPTIDVVLPEFRRFAEDSVLVAHNAAFDMKFLQLAQERTGMTFTQPVLDTLLLSAVVHPNQESHQLEAIAERLGVTLQGRHTALGDAMATAEIWLRLMAQLEVMGIHTLREAREAAERTWYARLKY